MESPHQSRYCRSCGYPLLGIDRVCPECGVWFDADNPKSFRDRPPGVWDRVRSGLLRVLRQGPAFKYVLSLIPAVAAILFAFVLFVFAARPSGGIALEWLVIGFTITAVALVACSLQDVSAMFKRRPPP